MKIHKLVFSDMWFTETGYTQTHS